jgi:hypothetical protein
LTQTEHRRSPPPTTNNVDYGELTEIFAWDGTRELSFSDLDPVVKNELLAWVKQNELGADIYASARNRKRSCGTEDRVVSKALREFSMRDHDVSGDEGQFPFSQYLTWQQRSSLLFVSAKADTVEQTSLGFHSEIGIRWRLRGVSIFGGSIFGGSIFG